MPTRRKHNRYRLAGVKTTTILGSPKNVYRTRPKGFLSNMVAKDIIIGLCLVMLVGFVGYLVYTLVSPPSYAEADSKCELARPHWNGEANYSYYNLLDEDGKAAYSSIEYAMRHMQEGADIPTMSQTDAGKAFDAVLMDNPDIFWVSNYYFQHMSLSGVESVQLAYLYDEADEVSSNHSSYIEQVDGYAQTCKSSAACSDNYELACASAAFRLTDANLSYGESRYDQTIVGFFSEDEDNPGNAVCAGYARTYKMLCDAMDISCVYVRGTSKSEEKYNHAWNMCRIGNEIYYADTTWGDNDAPGSWFTTDSEVFMNSHEMEEQDGQLVF